MTEELQAFCEDMDEQLSIMESTLLDIFEISIDEVDAEMINKIFRAMHTMKGNSGMFGFDNMVAFAHVAENLLDEIRNEKVKLTQEMVELFLLVNDHARMLIDLTVQNEVLDDEQLAYHNDLLTQLSAFLGLKEPNIIQTTSDKSEVDEENNTNYTIEIKPKDTFIQSDMDMFAIIKYLGVIGDIENLKIHDEFIPTLSLLEPLKSFLSLSMSYKSEEPLESIKAAFEFVIDDIELSIINTNKKEPIKEEKAVTKAAGKTKKSKTKSSSLRVDSSKVDQLVNLISEMVIANSKITQIANNDNKVELTEVSDNLTLMLEEVRSVVMDIRMVPVGSSLNKLRRIVTDTSKRLNKDIELVISGEETQLDKTVIEKISDPLVHMIRNSVDHGIESQEVRVKNGKSKTGKIYLRAYADAGVIVIEIQDDGAGIPKDIILNKAIENGLVSLEDKLSDKEIYDLIFSAGLSSANEISDVSGRGVGMDVVKRNIEDLKGHVEVDSTLGVGTKITIRLPLTLAIIDGFLVQSGQTKYIVPLEMIQECIKLTSLYRKKMNNNMFINLRGKILPLIDSHDSFETRRNVNQKENIVVVNVMNKRVGLIVNELHGEFQTVIKPLGDVFRQMPWVSGGTILGDGEIALILDIPMLIRKINVSEHYEYTN